MTERAPLLKLLDAGLTRGGLQNDDVIAVASPLFREVAALHEQGKVAALDDAFAYRVSDAGELQLAQPEGREPRANRDAIDKLQAPPSSVLRVVGESRLTTDADSGVEHRDLAVAVEDESAELTRPAYLIGYRAWEQKVDHHDAPADILCLGQVLASLACGLDFTSPDDLNLFAAHRDNLFRLQERLHPVIASVIVEMTALNRHERARDLPSIIRRLETYREQPTDLALSRVASAQDSAGNRRRAVQAHLRDRLFDLSRRNRLLHFRPTQSTVNLTVASVPLVVDLKSIRLDQLCVWGGRFAEEVVSGDKIPLSRWLRFEDQPYLPGSLDHIIQDARRDRAEYGFSQLSLVLAFLRWHNLKEDREERIVSPLLLLPVELTRKKGVRDQYLLEAHDSDAEVNPVLRQHLRQLYGIELPEVVDLRSVDITQFHRDLAAQIAASEPGVQLRLITQPEIELIHQRARQRLEQFRRRQRLRAPASTPSTAYHYSYSQEDFRPLGLQLFHDKVRPTPLPLRDAIGAPPSVRHPQMAADAEHTTFALRESVGNPYQWDFDLTAVTLGNFNYRKMSLVRDYSALIEADMPNPAFDRVFSLQPRAVETEAPAPLPLGEQWAVIHADATQSAAVALARTGASYIIQGPPGTGKSQTITNLIADYVGRGKRVLFVCEKRAAIDVVFHRLRQQGLDELCCMIHDSQADKKAFVLNLKQTYDHWLSLDDALGEIQRERQALLKSIDQDMQALQRFDAAMCAAPEHVAISVRELMHRLIALREHQPTLTAFEAEALPSFAVWRRHADLADRMSRTLMESVGVHALASHVFAHLGQAVIRHDRPVSRLAELADRAEALLDRCADAVAEAMAEQASNLTLADLLALIDHARRLDGVAARGQLPLLDGASDLSREFNAALEEMTARARAFAKAGERTMHWKEKLIPAEAETALIQARAQERSLLRWLLPSWWRLSGELKRRYDFARHAVQPPSSQVLADLVAEQQAQAALEEAREAIHKRFGCDDPDRFAQELIALREGAQGQQALAAFHARLLSSAAARTAVERLVASARDFEALHILLTDLLMDAPSRKFDTLGELVRDLRENADVLPELSPLLVELHDADHEFAQMLRTLAHTPPALECAVAQESLERVYRTERWLPRFDGAALARHVDRLAAAERKLFALNAQTIRSTVRQRFRENCQRATLAASQLDAEGKLFKKRYGAGRRELEHEFGKTMRYKAIRELASGDTGEVVRDMKPIWLMSPLSVSDTLPLAPDLFDVVIFDEASQIPVEEAVPALYRAPQVIVVGDEMQLPPTSFFSAARDDDEDTVAVEEEGERIAVILDADSLLNQAARNLSATLLAWHYRSRYESLIGFSNAAFYAGNLYTIPDRSLPSPDRGDILVRSKDASADTVAAHADSLLSRAISFHFVSDAAYVNRRNEGEARHIAELVRELLTRQTGHSVGIVAFSEAQQSEIESALETRAAADSEFAARLEAEYVREEDDQFCGLFIKNLENVQGDERDIVILSICYGPGPDGRMLMNFGPINQRGGEKRLNVIFSRARHHMAVVSTIRHDAITNDYNEGAAALKQFLRYAECMSRGDAETARRVLESLNPLARKALGDDGARDHVAEQMLTALRARGHIVDDNVGQSRFRCDLAIRDVEGGRYALGVFIDTAAHYANRNVFERYVSRPGILGAFGWRVIQVLSQDWRQDPEVVLDRIERALHASVDTAAEPDLDNETSSDNDAIELTSTEVAPSPAVGQEPPSATPASDSANRRLPVRRFEYIAAASRKFWEISQEGVEVAVTFGRIGTQGQTQIKQFPTETRAAQEIEKLIREKLKKGYQEIRE